MHTPVHVSSRVLLSSAAYPFGAWYQWSCFVETGDGSTQSEDPSVSYGQTGNGGCSCGCILSSRRLEYGACMRILGGFL